MRAVTPLVLLAVVGCTAKRAAGREMEPGKMYTVLVRDDAAHFRQVLPAPVDSVWRFVPQVFETLHFPGAPSVYQDQYVYLTPTLKVERRLYEGESNSLYLNCGFTTGGIPAADVYQVTFAIITRLSPQTDGKTEIDIVVDGTAQDLAVHRTAVRCDGTGRFEAIIFRRLEAMLRAHE